MFLLINYQISKHTNIVYNCIKPLFSQPLFELNKKHLIGVHSHPKHKTVPHNNNNKQTILQQIMTTKTQPINLNHIKQIHINTIIFEIILKKQSQTQITQLLSIYIINN